MSQRSAEFDLAEKQGILDGSRPIIVSVSDVPIANQNDEHAKLI